MAKKGFARSKIVSNIGGYPENIRTCLNLNIYDDYDGVPIVIPCEIFSERRSPQECRKVVYPLFEWDFADFDLGVAVAYVCSTIPYWFPSFPRPGRGPLAGPLCGA